MSDFLNSTLQWLNANPNLSGLGTFIISAAESVAIIGTIIPGSVMMTAIGALAGAGVIPLGPTIFWAIMGAIVGDGISYWIGRAFKDRLHTMWPFRTRPQLLTTGETFFKKYGGMSVFIGRFVGPVRALVPLVAGMLGMRPIQFYLANITSAIGWAPVYMLPGILLGAASLELPPDIAVHALLMIVLVSLFVILCLWLIYKFCVLISNQVGNALTTLWLRLEQSRFFHPITTLLKHYNVNKTHGQLTMAFFILVVSTLFVCLAFYIKHHAPSSIFLNDSLFYLARSLRTPTGDQIMIAITLLGEKTVILPLSITLFAWLAYAKRWRTAIHILLLGGLVAVSTEFFKYFVHSPRPWGIQESPHGFSFPSGHSVIAVAFYFGIGFLLLKAFKSKRFRLVLHAAALIALLIGISRIYLGAHWLTDVIGGWLLGAAVLMLVILSYNRKVEFPLQPKGILVTILLTLGFTYPTFYLTHIKKFTAESKQIAWPTKSTTLENWWQQQGTQLPLYRVNRFGMSDEVLNLQWLEQLSVIKSLLMKNGWEVPPEKDWATILHRISDIKSTEHLPLVLPLYLDEKPVLILIKHVNGPRKIIVLRLWNSHLLINNSSKPLWVGVVTVVPRTYGWLFNYSHSRQTELTPTVLFNKIPNNYDIKQLPVIKKNKKDQLMLLIKPKTES